MRNIDASKHRVLASLETNKDAHEQTSLRGALVSCRGRWVRMRMRDAFQRSVMSERRSRDQPYSSEPVAISSPTERVVATPRATPRR